MNEKFFEAARLGDFQGVKENIRFNSDVDWALLYAAESGNLEIVKFLLDNGATYEETITFTRPEYHQELKTIIERSLQCS